MSEELDLQKAKQVYATIVHMFERNGWKFEKNEDRLMVKSGFNGEDIPMDCVILVNPKNQVVQVLSALPFKMPEDKRVEGAIAVSVANYGLVDGCFDFDMKDGEIHYRLTSSYRGGMPDASLFEYMIACALSTVDDYNDRFFMLAKNMIDISKFIELDNQNH